MIYFIFGQDSYRAKQKLGEIVDGYKKVHKSGLNLIYIDAKEKDFSDVMDILRTNSMFAEKKLIILRSVFSNKNFQEELLENAKNLEELKDIVVVFEDCLPDQRTKLFKVLQKAAKCQEFKNLAPAMLRKWVAAEFAAKNSKISFGAADLLISFVGNNLWRMANEINKLSNYKPAIEREDVELMVRPDIENDIFKTIDALASKDKKQALYLLHKHIEDGEAPLYLLSMVSYQFRNLLTIKESQDKRKSLASCGLHPFVVQKTSYLCSQFSFEQLKKIYRKIFQIDLDIKTGKIEAETALDLLVSEI